MSLPKIIISLILALVFTFSGFTYSYAYQPDRSTSNSGPVSQNYLIIPISDQNLQAIQGQATASAIAGNLEGGQVLGIVDFFKDFFNALKTLGEGFVGAIKGLVQCVKNPAGCFITGIQELFSFVTGLFEQFIIHQIAGDAGDCVIAAQDTGPDSTGEPMPEKCKEIEKDLQSAIRGDQTAFQPGSFGLLGLSVQTTTTALAMPLPLNSTTYLASINPFAKAQASSGQDELAGNDIILEIWKRVRDASLILLVVALVIVGFMIMFRIPLGPRASVTAQNSLPRIAIAMLLIVFSFMLAGLMIDATRFLSDLLHSFLPPISVGGAFQGIGVMTAVLVLFLIAIFSIASIFTSPLGGLVVVLLFILLLAILLLIIFLIITYKLVSRLVIFLLMVMFAPLFFLAGALPRGEGAIFLWFKRSMAALLAIPATGFVITLAAVIGLSGVNKFDLDFAASSMTGPAGVFFGGIVDLFSWAFAGPIIGLVLLSFAIKVPDAVDELFGVRGLASRAGGIGMIVGAPGRAFSAVGSVGRSAQGANVIRKGAATVLTNRGWGPRPAPQPIPGGGEIVPPAPHAPKDKGFLGGYGPAFARIIRRVTGSPTAPPDEEARPWRPIIRDRAKEQQEATEAGQQPPTGQPGGTIPPDEMAE